MPYKWSSIRSRLNQLQKQNSNVTADLDKITQALSENNLKDVAKVREQTVKKYRDILREKAIFIMKGPDDVSESSMLHWIERNMDALTVLAAEDYSLSMPNSEIANIQKKCQRSIELVQKFTGHDFAVDQNDPEAEKKFEEEMKQGLEQIQNDYYDTYYNDPTLGGSVAEPEQAEAIQEEIPTPVINREQLNIAYRAYHTENLGFFNSIKDLVEYDVNKKVHYNREANVLYSEDEDGLMPAGEKKRYESRNKQLIEEGKHFAELKYRKEHEGENITNEQINKVRNEAETHVKAEISRCEKEMKDARSAQLLHTAKIGRSLSRPFNDRWEQILKDNQEELRKETFALLKGPKSLNANDMAQWSFETVHARTIFAVAFANGKSVIDKETDAALKASVELGDKFQRKCDKVRISHSNAEISSLHFHFTDVSRDNNFTVDDSIDMDVFAEDGTILWDSEGTVLKIGEAFKKSEAEALFKQVKDNYDLHQNDPEMMPYKEKAIENDNSIDGVIASLKKFRSDLKATDPFYVRNSGNFRKLKDELSDTIDALKKFKEHPLDSRMASVKDTLGKLQKAADAYTVQKSNELGLNDRGSKRLGITKKLNEFASKTITRDLSREWGAANRKMLDAQVNTAKKMARDLLFGKTNMANKDLGKAFADAVRTFKKFPAGDVKDARNELATAIGCAVQATKNADESFLNLEEFSDIKNDMVDLAKRGINQIAKAKKASGITEPDYEKMRDKQNATMKAREDDDLDDDLESECDDNMEFFMDN